MCSQSHFSFGVHRGGRFTKFTCPTCGYNPTQAQWKADYDVLQSLSDEEQKEQRKKHNALGSHAHQLLFMAPMFYFPSMSRVGVDQLHLIYLNFFKHLFRYTVHENLPESKKILIRNYLKEAGYYSYDAASDDEDPVKRWIGREVRRFLSEAHMHLPFLLQVAHAPIDQIPDTHPANVGTEADDAGSGDEEMDVEGDEFEPTFEEIDVEEQEEPDLMQDASRWDRFLDSVRECQSRWVKDDDEYRRKRALAYLNLSLACSRDLLALKPTMKSWVPHVSSFIVPQQIVLHGEPAKRSTDASESFGAVLKYRIKHQTCRRRVRTKERASIHKNNSRTWKQAFTKGYIEQAFRRACVAESLLHGAENEPFLSREDWMLKHKGLKKEGKVKPDSGVPPRVRDLVADDADL